MFELVKIESGLGITVLHISSILSRQLPQYKMNKPISWMSFSSANGNEHDQRSRHGAEKFKTLDLNHIQ